MDSLRIENLSGYLREQSSPGGVERSTAVTERLAQKEASKNNLTQKPGADGDIKGSFSDLLKGAFEEANVHQHQADVAIRNLVAGRTKNPHEAMLAIERADMSLKLLVQVRNKILDAYREVMRMQV